jgi:hypothetical protein
MAAVRKARGFYTKYWMLLAGDHFHIFTV